MRKLMQQWKTLAGSPVARIEVGSRGCSYFMLFISTVSGTEAPRDVKTLRLKTLQQYAQWVGHNLSVGMISQVTAEEVLDYIYAELNRRLNK